MASIAKSDARPADDQEVAGLNLRKIQQHSFLEIEH